MGDKRLPTMRLEIIQDGKKLQANSEQGEGKMRNRELLAGNVGKNRGYWWVVGRLLMGRVAVWKKLGNRPV